MAKLTAAEAAEKHARRLKASIEDMRQGVDRVTEAPGKKAAAKADKMLANLTAKIQDGTWAKRVGAVPLDKWKSDMINKGLGRVASGIDNAYDKQVDFYGQLLPAVDAAAVKVKTMPDMTIEDSINRVGTYMREMHKFSKK